MKLQIPTKTLLSALATLKPIAKPSTTHPILGNVAIGAEGESVTLTGTDMEKHLSIVLPCKVKEPGSTTIPATKLHDSLSKMRAPECSIEHIAIPKTLPTGEKITEHQITVRSGGAVTKLLGLGMEDMPQPIKTIGGQSVTIPAAKFASLLTKSLAHASSDKSRAILNSVFLVSRTGKLFIQSTDGRRAILCDSGIDFASDGAFIVPKESVPTMVALSTDGDVTLLMSPESLTIKTGDREFSTKLIEGNPPNFDNAIPKDRPLNITMNRAELTAIVEYAEIQTSEQSSAVKLVCDGKTMTATGASGKSGAEEFMNLNEDSAPVKKGSDNIEFAMNPQFLRDAMKALSEDEVTLEMANEMSAVVIQEDGIMVVLMPMRIG